MKPWSYLRNPFLTAAQKSYRQGLKISTYYNAQLLANNSDPFIANLYANYNALHTNLSSAYSNWAAEGGTLKGNTLSVDQLLKLLCPTMLDAWEYKIMGVFARKTPRFVGIFPKGRKPFHRGSKELRISAVAQLSTSLAGIPALAAVRADVDDFYILLTDNREVQLGSKGTKENRSRKVETAIKNAMAAMFADYGLLINRHIDNLNKVEPYFDINTIRNHKQITFRKTVPETTIRTIVQHTFNANDSISIKNDGKVRLELYLAQRKLAPPLDSQMVAVEPGAELTFAITDLGDLKNHFLNVRNLEIHKGHCIIELI